MKVLVDSIFQFSTELLVATAIIWAIKFYIEKRRILLLGNKIPGNKGWPILGNALEFIEKDIDLLKRLTHLNKKYGVFRFWLGSWLHVVICTAEDAEIFFNSTVERSEHIKFYKPIVGDGIFSANGARWMKSKRLLEPLFTYPSVQKYFPVIKKNRDKLIEILREKSKKQGYPYNRCVQYCLYDIISEAMFNSTVGAQDGNAKLLELTEELMGEMWTRGFSTWQQIDIIYRLSKTGKKYYQNVELIKNFVDDQIASFRKIYFENKEILKDPTNEKDVKNKFFLLKLMDNEEWSDIELRHEVISMLVAGFETLSPVSNFTAMMLGIHKDVQERVYQEVTSVLEENFNVEDVMKLEYLERVIKETMRIFPVGPLGFRRLTKDVQFTEYLVPKNSTVVINTFLIHRDPKYWDNPNNFDPDHFLPEKVAKRHKYAYHPFSLGKRKCIGAKFGLITLKNILAKLIQNFKIECDFGMEDIEREMIDTLTLKIRNSHYPIRLIPREL